MTTADPRGSVRAPASPPDVVAFDDPLDAALDRAALLGGKGAGLVEMSGELGLPVPPGFIVTTEVCRRFRAAGWPPDLDAALAEHLDRLAAAAGRRFGDLADPLLVSVRSGAPVSMPGMLDTVLNVGITPAHVAAAHDEAAARFIADTWLRFCRLYAEVVLAIPKSEIDVAATAGGETPSESGALLAAADGVRALADRAGGIPADPLQQLRAAISAVFRSCDSPRARAFRKREGITDEIGTAVTVQAMVFGNLDERSGTGVVFTRDPASGERAPYGDYLARAQGDDVVAGSHAVGGLDTLRTQLPEVYAELRSVLDRLERHYRDMCDVEFTVSKGRLYILQTRVGRRSPLAAVRIAVDMAEDPDFPLTRADAVARVDAATLQQLTSLARVDPAARPLATGLAVSPGVGVGALTCDPDRAADLAARGIDVVLAREETSPADIHGMVGAAALVTTLGGVASHAAVVARSWSIPAVTGARDIEVRPDGILIAGRLIPEGQLLTVDGATGAVYEGDRRLADQDDHPLDLPAVRTLRRWAADLGVEPGAGSDPSQASGSGSARGADVSLLELARTVQLKGLCTPDRAAAALAIAQHRIDALLDAHGSHFQSTPRGILLTPEGREWLTSALDAERTSLDRAALNRIYERFTELNARFKELVSTWQLHTSNAATAPEPTPTEDGEPAGDPWSAVVASLTEIDAALHPLVEETAAQLPRLAAYAPRFRAALTALRAGDPSMLASPLKDSYHTVWFEFHEELIHATARDRATEERKGS